MKNTIKLAIMLLAVSAVMSTSCKKDPQAPNNGKENGHEWVDLGLPSGLKWATCNIGADKPEAYGNYFAWGETEPQDNNAYDWDSYKYYTDGTLTKYTSTDGLTTLEASDDAASVNWGGTWRMPTSGEMQELIDNCTMKWTTQNGVKGRLFTSSNGNSIFLPAAGYRNDGELLDEGNSGEYWSSLLGADYPDIALGFSFVSDNYRISNYYRNYGFTVRSVCPAK